MSHTTFGHTPGLLFAASVVATVSCWLPSAEQTLQPRLLTLKTGQPTASDPINGSAAMADDIAHWHEILHRRAERIAKLESGWDGPGSVAISGAVLNMATTLIERAIKHRSEVTLPYFVPGGDGSLQIEWHRKHGELELDIQSDATTSIWIKNHTTGLEIEADGEEAISHFYRWAAWISSSPDDANHVHMPKPSKFITIEA